MHQNYLTYYQLLEVESNATTEEILSAYKVKAMQYHPDKNDGHFTANKLFQYLQDAKEILTNPERRTAYDYMIGVKEKPAPPPTVVHVPVKNNDMEELLIAGGLGVLIGVWAISLLKNK